MKDQLNDIKLYDKFAILNRAGKHEILKDGDSWDELKNLYNEIMEMHRPDQTVEVSDTSVMWKDDRWRCHIFNSDRGWGCAMRRNPSVIPHLQDDLGFELDKVLSLTNGSGLIIIAGPTGAGKTTTMASLINYLSERGELGDTVTIEEPIEYSHSDPLICQREVGINVGSFHGGVHEAMRQSPRNIIIGEIRHPNTAEAAIQAGLTGHRVFATLHAENIHEVVTRMFGLLDKQHDELLPQAIQGFICQHLVHGISGKTHCIYETLHASPQVRSILSQGPAALPRLNHEMYQQKRKSLSEYAKSLVISGQLQVEEIVRWTTE
ncbi:MULTISPECIES: ATPase, T2SS/T4P/T4SS family [unclassified Methylophaga]|jgi:twitching motility protein PilT|uniref:ATPase, T2SS/T4P/T4SS family n=1 Tax=unclassified Methylophaga TaxID=2629249 RepID=UPI000C8A4C84|nr:MULTISPECIES: ATPase, T2SS/T4P/T4SS family [unclassified Methylophaga]MAP28380.1 twitching motility protein [Methylophaga sp.]|tara:strand:+ start:4814 stop:5776 length:963 start_codon:yes stop_codon:yes gene_type:complete